MSSLQPMQEPADGANAYQGVNLRMTLIAARLYLRKNDTGSLTVAIEEGPQYHMGKLDIVADKEEAGRLRMQWKLAEGAVYDNTYIDEYLTAARDILPPNFSRENVQRTQNCPEALVQVRLIVDPAQDKPHSELKDVACEDKDKGSK